MICKRLGKEAAHIRACRQTQSFLLMHNLLLPRFGVQEEGQNTLHNYAHELGSIVLNLAARDRDIEPEPTGPVRGLNSEYNKVQNEAEDLFEDIDFRKRIFDSIAHGVGFGRFK